MVDESRPPGESDADHARRNSWIGALEAESSKGTLSDRLVMSLVNEIHQLSGRVAHLEGVMREHSGHETEERKERVAVAEVASAERLKLSRRMDAYESHQEEVLRRLDEIGKSLATIRNWRAWLRVNTQIGGGLGWLGRMTLIAVLVALALAALLDVKVAAMLAKMRALLGFGGG